MLFFNLYTIFVFIFFFQAEDGIRDIGVTGVQTCALPIWRGSPLSWLRSPKPRDAMACTIGATGLSGIQQSTLFRNYFAVLRSEERRVGKECRSRGSAYH